MKKTLLTCAVAVTGVLSSAIAQHAPTIDVSHHSVHEYLTEEPTSTSPRSSGSRVTNYNDTIWFDGFENPSLWNSTNNNPSSDGWVISNAGGTNQGTWFFANTRIQSTTGGNYAVMVPDDPNNNPLLTQSILQPTSALDISAYSGQNLVLHYEFYAARFIDTLKAQVSGDNANWITLERHQDLPITSLAAGNNLSDNPDSRELFIPTSVVNSDSLYIRFLWDGNTAQPGIGYGWFIDDVMVLDVLDNDLVLDETAFFDPVRLLFSWYFGAMPVKQAEADSIYVSGTHINYGKSDQTNVQLELNVTGPVNSSYQSGTTNTAAGAAGDTLITTGQFAPSTIGTYDLTWNITSDSVDSNPANNMKTIEFDVTDDIYSMPPYPISKANSVGKSGPLGASASGGPYRITQDYYFMDNDSILEIGIAFDSEWSEPVSAFQLRLLDANGAAVAQTSFIQLTAAMITDDVVFFPMQTPTAIPAGSYEAELEYFGATGDSLFVVSSNDPLAPIEPTGGGFFSRTTIIYDNDGTGASNFIEDMVYMVLRTSSSCSLTASGNVDSPSTCGNNDGEATVTGSNGATPYTYAWSNGASGANQTNLSSGTYTITVSDANSCTALVTIDVLDDDAPEVTGNVTNLTCFGDNTGEVDITVTSNNSPFSYSWSNNSSSEDISGLAAGSYTVTVTDNSGCTATEVFDVTEPAELTASISEDDPNFGDAVASGNGGTSPYSYSWSTGETTAAITGASGPVTVTVTDANNCTAETSGNITPVSTNDLSFASSLNIFPNPNNGNFNVAFTDMSGIYTVSVVSTIGQVIDTKVVAASGNHVETFNMNNLNNGIYFITVKSEAGSEATFRVVVK